MNTISKLEINAFRGISNLKISDLSTVNVLAGANNCGKTSVLEAIDIVSLPTNFAWATKIAFSRLPLRSISDQDKIVDVVASLFKREIDEDGRENYHIDIKAEIPSATMKFESSGEIEELISLTGETKKTFSVSVKTQKNNEKASYDTYQFVNGQSDNLFNKGEEFYRSLFINTNISYYNACVAFLSDSIIKDKKLDLIGMLKRFDPNITDISIVGDDVYIHDKVSGTLPLYAYGAGMQKAVMLTGILAVADKGVILIDEIDNAINISAFEEVFSWFVRRCKERNIQAFITTHSAEAIDAILECVDEDDNIRIITLRKTPKSHTTIAKVRTGKEAICDRKKFNMELRV